MKKLLVFALVIVFAACTTKSDKDEIEQIKETAKFDETTKVMGERFNAIYNTIPSSELAAYLESVDAAYNGTFINDPGKASEYLISSEQTALALGVYYMDIHYAAAYKKSDQTTLIYDAMALLADSVGMGRVFNQAMLKEFNEQLEDNPEAKKYIEDALVQGSKNLNTSTRPRLATLIMTGFVIERLYLLTSIINEARDNSELAGPDLNLMITPLMQAVARQSDNIDQMVESINLIRTADDEAEGFVLMYELKQEYAALEAIKDDIDATETVDPQILDNIFTVIVDLRTRIITPGR